MVLDGFVVYTENLRKLVGVAGTILKSFDDFSPAGSSAGSSEQIPKESFEVPLAIERCLGVFPCRRP